MKSFRLSLTLIAACALAIGGAAMSVHGTPAPAGAPAAGGLSADTNKELARARGATAKYHDIAQAEADGYVNINEYMSGEGFHYVNFALVDCNFDPEHPEALLYAPVPHENRLRLVGVEYAMPLGCSNAAPAGFSGDADVWREDTEGLGLWELNAWLWLNNPNGVFANTNPRVP